MLTLDQQIEVVPYRFDANNQYLASMVLEADFLMKKSTTLDPYDSDRMAAEFLMQFPRQAFSVGQQLAFAFPEKKMLLLTCKELEAMDMKAGGKPYKVNLGVTMPNTVITFEKADNSPLVMTGKAKGKQVCQSIINPDWDFNKMGIGGLDNEFSAIFRRAFASRVFPPEIVLQLGMALLLTCL
ncbi:hypothetical protein LSH36_366g05020 [Paralvinella palmiformis]|uniref:Vesicle-fusing ATPase n=1 Tax=Paralvinella palmiformis TaxID=53620 RepID=A0AAD9JEA0_9ANNE|nr:hypothetical protein LSH36_366g05020 [Paralvinella palmiformis]